MSQATRTAAPRADGYTRRRPEHSVLHRLLSEHFPAFRERAEEHGGLPRFVEREVQEYLRCGDLDYGCVLVVCRDCGDSQVVAFSCKRRGFCPSCCGRRMNDAALHLTARVIPEVPIRQWVCSLPWQLRALLGYDRVLCGEVLRAWASELSRSYKRRAKRELGLRSVSDAQTGAVTFVQRFDSALRLNVHFHTLALDGVYVRDACSAELRFMAMAAPTLEQIHDVAKRTEA
jgi:Transposase zinc-binding domain/Putative transposase